MRTSLMRSLAKWHIWLGWLVGVPMVMWLATGLLMVARPIEHVRGDHIQREAPPNEVFASGTQIAFMTPAAGALPFPGARPAAREVTATRRNGETVYRVTYADGSVQRFSATGVPIPALGEAAARALVRQRIIGGDAVTSVRLFGADELPFEFPRPIAVWQVALADGTNIYVGRDTGEIEAVRTRWWRAFDFAWGLHIMDFSEREDTSHPILILFTALSLSGALIGCVLMFRRRRARVQTRSAPGA